MFPFLYRQPTPDGSTLDYGTWGLMLILAFLACTMVAWRRLPKIGVNPDVLTPLLMLSVVTSIIGSRLMHFVFAEPEKFFSNPLIFFSPREGGMAVLGGVMLASICGVIFLKRRGLPAIKMADAITPTIFLGMAIGRVGCFFAGCCHGRVCDAPTTGSLTGGFFPGGEILGVQGFPWIAFSYHRGQTMGSIYETPVYPTQLMDAVVLFGLFLLTSWIWKHWRKWDGQLVALYCIFAGSWRIVIELFRGDEIRGTGYFGFLSTGQVSSLALVAVGVVVAALTISRGRGEEVAYEDEDDDDALAYADE